MKHIIITILFTISCLTQAQAASLIKVDTNYRIGAISFYGTEVNGVGAYANSSQSIYRSVKPSLTSPFIDGQNLYAPSVVKNGSVWNVFFGGWRDQGQTNDRIYLSITDDAELIGDFSVNKQLIIDNGDYSHINDPAAWKDGSAWYMTYTAAKYVSAFGGTYFRDWINYSTSTDGSNWSPSSGSTSTELSFSDPNNLIGGTLMCAARPAMVRRNGTWYLWFDAVVFSNPADIVSTPEPNWPRFGFLATASANTPTAFTIVYKFPTTVEMSEWDVRLKPSTGEFVIAYLRHPPGTPWRSKLFTASSMDGVNWSNERLMLDSINDYPSLPARYLSNPGVIFDPDQNRFVGVLFPADQNDTVCNHKIYVAFNQLIIQVRSPGGVWHVFGNSNMHNEWVLSTNGYSTFDWIKVFDPITWQTLLDQPFTGENGDLWFISRP